MRTYLLHPHVQTSLFIFETTNLKMQAINQFVKLETTGRKDRYSSVSYANLLASLFDKELLRQDSDEDEWSILEGITQVL